MLNKKYRLKKERNFKLVYSRGRSIFGKFVNVKYYSQTIPGKILDEGIVPKIGIVVSKKISNKASVRNKIKRQISSIVHEIIDNREANMKVVINVKKIPDIFNDLKNDISICFKKIGL